MSNPLFRILSGLDDETDGAIITLDDHRLVLDKNAYRVTVTVSRSTRDDEHYELCYTGPEAATFVRDNYTFTMTIGDLSKWLRFV